MMTRSELCFIIAMVSIVLLYSLPSHCVNIDIFFFKLGKKEMIIIFIREKEIFV